jgi:hypothetical protein
VNGLFGVTLTMLYDAVGNRTEVRDSFGGIVTSTYDAANNLQTRKLGGTNPLRIDLTYNANNQLETARR